LFTIGVDFCDERLQGFGVESAEILRFYLGEMGGCLKALREQGRM
jgi:hypothetical protein